MLRSHYASTTSPSLRAAAPTNSRKGRYPDPTDALIDAENLFPGGWWHYGTSELASQLRAVLDIVPDHARVLIVCCAALAARLLDVVLEEELDLRVVAPTPNAADLLLAHHLEAIPQQTHVLLVTGDGGLTSAVTHHVAAGGQVTIAAITTQLSKRLQAAATATHLLNPPIESDVTTQRVAA